MHSFALILRAAKSPYPITLLTSWIRNAAGPVGWGVWYILGIFLIWKCCQSLNSFHDAENMYMGMLYCCTFGGIVPGIMPVNVPIYLADLSALCGT